jgi:hypothetical protein
VVQVSAVRPAAAAHPSGHLGNAIQVPGLQALNVTGSAAVSAVRCLGPGSSTAVGNYKDRNGHFQAFLANEARFKWGKATPAPGLAQLGGGGPTDITALSCPAAGRCTIGGWYVDPSANLQAFADSSTGGVFGPAAGIFTVTDQVSSFVARVTALSCATAGNCTAALEIPAFPAGGGEPIPRAFVVTQAGGLWGTPGQSTCPASARPRPPGSARCRAGTRPGAWPSAGRGMAAAMSGRSWRSREAGRGVSRTPSRASTDPASPTSTRTPAQPPCRCPAPSRRPARSPGSTATATGTSRPSPPAGTQATGSPRQSRTRKNSSRTATPALTRCPAERTAAARWPARSPTARAPGHSPAAG